MSAAVFTAACNNDYVDGPLEADVDRGRAYWPLVYHKRPLKQGLKADRVRGRISNSAAIAQFFKNL